MASTLRALLGEKSKTVEIKKTNETSKRFELHKLMEKTLGSGDLRGAVRLPPDEDECEWLAVNVIDFFNQVNLLYGSVSVFCTEKTCPVMSAGPKYEYLWSDGKTIKKPLKCSAPEYCSYLLNWVQDLLEDESIFPVNENAPFPKSFRETIKGIFKRLFRVYGHIYYSHAQEIIDLKLDAHLNTAFKHFYLFIHEFALVSENDMAPLKTKIDHINQNLK